MKLLRTVGRGFARVGAFLVHLVRDDAYTDVRATYPDMKGPTQQQAATSASVITSISGLGNG